MTTSYREECERAKAVKRGLIEQRPLPARKPRGDRPWSVMCPPLLPAPRGRLSKPWAIYRGATYEACQRWIEKEARNNYRPDGVAVPSRTSRYWIEGPKE